MVSITNMLTEQHDNNGIIPVAKPLLPTFDKVKSILQAIDNNRKYSNFGPVHNQLVVKYADYFNVDESQIVLASNATMALIGLLEISHIKNWILPNFTFAATGLAALASRKKLFLSDVCPDSFKIKNNFFPIEFNPDSFGILPVAPFGGDFDFTEFEEFDHVIIDAAASIGSQKLLKEKIRYGWSIVFSLHATKIFPAPEGAVVVCGNSGKAKEFRKWTSFGFDSNRSSVQLGTNAKLSEVHSAYALASLINREIEYAEWNSKLNIAKNSVKKQNQFIDFGSGIRPYWICKSPCAEDKIELEMRLNRHKVGFRNWWERPLSSMPAFQDQDNVVVVSDYNARVLSSTLTGLPMFRDLSDEQIRFIADIL